MYSSSESILELVPMQGKSIEEDPEEVRQCRMRLPNRRLPAPLTSEKLSLAAIFIFAFTLSVAAFALALVFFFVVL